MARLMLKTEQSSISFEIGTEHHVQGAHIHIYAGGSEYKSGNSVYEADKGYIILEAIPRIIGKWGASSYSTALTATNSNVETIENISKYFEELARSARARNDEKNEQVVHWVQKQILDYYFRYSSRNARFEVRVECKSHEIRIPLPWPWNVKIDTKTANLEMHFTLRILKLITPEEMNMVNDFLASAIAKGLPVDYEYA